MAARNFVMDKGKHNATTGVEAVPSAGSKNDFEASSTFSVNEISREDVGKLNHGSMGA